MNPEIDKNEQHFDRSMRQLHASAVERISPQTLARLRAARHQAQTTAPRSRHAWRWVTASVFSAVLAIGVGLQMSPQSATSPSVQTTATASGEEDLFADNLSTLDENPDLYVWLASSDADPLAME